MTKKIRKKNVQFKIKILKYFWNYNKRRAKLPINIGPIKKKSKNHE